MHFAVSVAAAVSATFVRRGPRLLVVSIVVVANGHSAAAHRARTLGVLLWRRIAARWAHGRQLHDRRPNRLGWQPFVGP